MDLSFDMDNNNKPNSMDQEVILNGEQIMAVNQQDVANDMPKDVNIFEEMNEINQETKGVEQCSQLKEKVFLSQAAQLSSTEHAFAGCKFENCTFNFIFKK
jgi:activator of HSP90 ATPase